MSFVNLRSLPVSAPDTHMSVSLSLFSCQTDIRAAGCRRTGLLQCNAIPQISTPAPQPAAQQNAHAPSQKPLESSKGASASTKKSKAQSIRTQTFTQALELPEESVAAETSPLNLMFVAAEVAPWSKTGGLGDVVGGLPIELAKRGHRVLTVAPRYDQYKGAT